jgi:hypothetical protein
MHTLHKPMKVHAQLALAGQAVKKRIHKIGLATPYPTPEVQPALGLPSLTKTTRQARKHTTSYRGARLQALKQILQSPHRGLLCRIMAEVLSGEIVLVALPGC